MPRFLKAFLWTLGSLALFCLIVLSILPTLLSTDWGTKTFVEWYNARDHGKLTVENIELNWIGAQSAKNLAYEDKNGEKLLSVEKFNTKTSLLYFLFGGRHLGETEILKPYVVYTQEVEKEENEKKKKHKASKTRATIWPRLEKGFTVKEGTLILKQEKLPPITISEIDVQALELPDTYQISAKTLQGAAAGTIAVDISLLEKLHAKGDIKNFPLAILDQVDESTLYTDAIGPTFDIHFDLTKEPNKTLSLTAEIQSQNLNGSLKGETREKKLYLDPSSHLVFTVTPRFFKYLLPESQKDVWTLASNTNVQFEISEGIFPLSTKKAALHDVVLQAKGTVERAEIVHKALGSYSFNNFKMEVIALSNLEISYQGEIHGKEPSSLSGTLSLTPKGEITFSSNYKGFPVSLVQLLSPSLEKNIRLAVGNLFDLNTEGTYRNGKIEMQGTLIAHDLQVSGELYGPLNRLNFDISGFKTLAGKKAEYIGKTAEFEIDGVAHLSKNSASIPLINGKITTPFYLVTVKGTIGDRGGQIDLNEVELVATGKVLELPYAQEFPNVTLKNGNFVLNVDGPSNKILGKASINTQVHYDKGVMDSKALQARFEMSDYIREDALDFENAHISFSSELDHLPLALLTPFAPDELDIPELFGTTATIISQGEYAPTQDPSITLDLNITGEGVQASLSLAVDGTISVAQNKPSFVHWELTPSRYQALVKYLRPEQEPAFQLTKSAPIDLSIKELTCPTTPYEGVGQFLCKTGFVGNLSIGTLTFRSVGTQEYLVIDHTAGSIEGVDFSQAIELHLHGDVLAQNIPQSESSSFQFDGNLFNFWTPEGKFNREGLTVDGELNLELLPVRQLTEIYPMDQETRVLVQAVLGELVNARIYGRISQMSGPLTVDVKSSNFKATLPILLQPEGIYLRDVVDAELTLTPEVNQTLITDINPLLIAGAYSDHPIRIVIDPQGFMIPIHPYNLQGVKIGKAMIDIGRIRIRNGGDIQELMNFLKATDITPDGEMTAWFTPIYMSQNNGVASYSRVDMLLANEFHIALWGSINLITNKVRMTLGIAPSTLKKRFNIAGLSKKDMFQVKMRGTTKDLDLDWSSATTRIGILVGTAVGGPIGSLIGGILEQIVSALGDEPSPPPTTSPFPWEK